MHIINSLRPILKKLLPESFYLYLRKFYRGLNYLINESFQLIIHTFRYFSIYNPDYKINLNLGFGIEENIFFKSELKKCELFLEYGSGKSTLMAIEYKKDFFAIESDKNFFKYMVTKIGFEKHLRFVDFGIVKFASIPIFFNFRKKKLSRLATKYNFDILEELSLKNKIPDFILVDGRYRVMSGIALYKFYKKNSKNFTIIFDDYSKRDFYIILDKLFYIKKLGRIGVSNGLKMVDDSEVERLLNIYVNDFR
jgi:hypothetical protein